MDNTNESQIPQQAPMPPAIKKWHQHKGIISIIVLAVIAAVLVWVYFILNQPQVLGPVAVHHKSKSIIQTQQLAISTPANTSGWQTSTATQQTALNTLQDDGINFPIPAIYSKDEWYSASATSSESDIGSNEFDINGNALSLTGQFYQATNTDPGILAWEQSNTNGTNTDGGFYGGDQNFLTYYEQTLTNTGYKTEVDLDQNLNVIQNWQAGTNQANPAYTLLPSSGDGPLGTITGYIKYYQGRARVIDISSSTTENEVFISNVFNVQSLISFNQ